jgi:hypothetical protein
MDQDIRELNRTYLLKAREYAISGDSDKARFLLGMPVEASRILEKMSIRQINRLAETDLVCFDFRIQPNTLRNFEEIAEEGPMDELKKCQLLASIATRRIDEN